MREIVSCSIPDLFSAQISWNSWWMEEDWLEGQWWKAKKTETSEGYLSPKNDIGQRMSARGCSATSAVSLSTVPLLIETIWVMCTTYPFLVRSLLGRHASSRFISRKGFVLALTASTTSCTGTIPLQCPLLDGQFVTSVSCLACPN